MVKKSIIARLQLLITLLLFAFVAYQAGLFDAQGRETFLSVLKNASIGLLCLSIVIGVMVNLSSALKWYMLVQAQGMRVAFWRIFAYYLIGQFYNILMPTSVGGDVVRSYQLGAYTGRQADVLASVFVERYSGVVVLLLLAFLAMLLQLSEFNTRFIWLCLGLFSIVLLLIGWLVLDNQVYRVCASFLRSRFVVLEAILLRLDKLFASLNEYKGKQGALLWAGLNSLIFYFLAAVNVYVSALVFDQSVSFMAVLLATPIIMLIMNIPLSIGNLGLMEFAYSSVFQLMGYSPSLGLSVALLMRLKSLLDALMGAGMQSLFLSNSRR